MTKPDSPAFPEDRSGVDIYSGLTIREYMATQIMTGLAASPVGELPAGVGRIADVAVSWAEALIDALNRTPAAPDQKGG